MENEERVPVPARIKDNVMVLPSRGGVSDFPKGKDGFVRPETTKNSFGTTCYVWITSYDNYYVPAFAIELLQ